MSNIVFSDEAWEDYLHWQETNRQTVRRINQLIKDIQRSPHQGIGKPEPLKYALAGFWSRRIDLEHRIVYRVTADGLEIASLRYHY